MVSNRWRVAAVSAVSMGDSQLLVSWTVCAKKVSSSARSRVVMSITNSLALRDARILGEILVENDDWTIDGLGEYASERTTRLAIQRFTAELSAANYRYFRDVDDERARFASLMASHTLLDGLRSEVFLGGLTRTTEELSEAKQILDQIEDQLSVHNGDASLVSER